MRALNANLAVLTTASDALLMARRDGLEPFEAVFDAVGGEDHLAATVEAAKRLIRPLDMDARDLIQTQYAFVRGALLALYEALDVRAVRGTDPAIEALDYIQQLNARGRRVTARRSRLGGEPVEAPIGHVTERWRRLVFEGRKGINASMYEVAAFEALNHGLRSGDLYVLGSRRYHSAADAIRRSRAICSRKNIGLASRKRVKRVWLLGARRPSTSKLASSASPTCWPSSHATSTASRA